MIVPARWRSYALGAFVCFEAAYLPAANFIKLFPARGLPKESGEIRDDILQERLADDVAAREPTQSMVDAVAIGTIRWAELTGQNQYWRLFAPDHPHQAVFPEIELRWDDRRVVLANPRVPANPDRYFVWPSTSARLGNYEARIVLVYWRYSPEDQMSRPEYWRKQILSRVHHMSRSTEAYLRWRMNTYLREHPAESMPREVILNVRCIPSRRPARDGGDRPGAYVMPLARWAPTANPSPENLPIEAWDLDAGAFAPLKKEGPP